MDNIFTGLGVALITPMLSDGAVDYDALAGLIDQQIAAGVDFMCVLGTTAETPCLHHGERAAVARFAIERIAGRVPVLLGAGANCTFEVEHHLHYELPQGVDGVLIVAPFYNKPSQEGLYQHFRAVAKATPLPVVLYNVPGRTGVNIQPDTTLRLAREVDNIVAIKEASGQVEQILRLVREAPAGFDVLSGDDGLALQLCLAGARGLISVVANAYPAGVTRMVHLAMQGDEAEARELDAKYRPLYGPLFADGNPSGIKCLLSQLGHCQNYLRLPLVPVSGPTEQALRQAAVGL